MKKIYYGAAIQGSRDPEERAKRAPVHKRAIEVIHQEGFQVITEHASGATKEETAELLERTLGKVPEDMRRKTFIRRMLLKSIDSPLSGFIFEVSVPSTGTGIEIDHACTREARGLNPLPILALYETGYWPFDLSTMVRGIEKDELPNFTLQEYANMAQLENTIRTFLHTIRNSE